MRSNDWRQTALGSVPENFDKTTDCWQPSAQEITAGKRRKYQKLDDDKSSLSQWLSLQNSKVQVGRRSKSWAISALIKLHVQYRGDLLILTIRQIIIARYRQGWTVIRPTRYCGTNNLSVRDCRSIFRRFWWHAQSGSDTKMSERGSKQ